MLLYINLGHNEVLASNTLQHVTHITATRLLCEPFQYQAIAREHMYANAGVCTNASTNLKVLSYLLVRKTSLILGLFPKTGGITICRKRFRGTTILQYKLTWQYHCPYNEVVPSWSVTALLRLSGNKKKKHYFLKKIPSDSKIKTKQLVLKVITQLHCCQTQNRSVSW